MSTLLRRIKAAPVEQQRKQAINSEFVEVAVAWMKDEINPIQYQKVTGKPLYYNAIAMALRHAYRKGIIK